VKHPSSRQDTDRTLPRPPADGRASRAGEPIARVLSQVVVVVVVVFLRPTNLVFLWRIYLKAYRLYMIIITNQMMLGVNNGFIQTGSGAKCWQEFSQRATQNSHGHAKEFLRKLSTIWASALKKVRQPCARGNTTWSLRPHSYSRILSTSCLAVSKM
jgi:hypothetical protein